VQPVSAQGRPGVDAGPGVPFAPGAGVFAVRARRKNWVIGVIKRVRGH
jgi:hypothetical protein